MRRGWQVTVAGVAGVVLVAGAVVAARPTTGARPSADPGPTSTSTAAPPAPAVVKDCWVPTPAGTVSLTSDEAKTLTTVAATATDPERREERLLDAVRTLEVTPEQAVTVARSLVGDRRTQRLTCSYARLAVEPEDPGPSGLTPRARRLRAAWTEVFGPLVAGGFAAGGVDSGHVDSSSHYEGRAMDVFFRPLGDDEQRRRGRVLAQWLVAHAQDFNVLSVIYADRIWTSWAAYAGWREYVHPSGNSTNPILRHLDHVHVAVESGEPYRG